MRQNIAFICLPEFYVWAFRRVYSQTQLYCSFIIMLDYWHSVFILGLLYGQYSKQALVVSNLLVMHPWAWL